MRRARLIASALSLALLATVLPATAASAAACPNEAIRASQTSEALPAGTTHLPGCMALEMVSPPKKFGQEASDLSAFSPDGTRALYKSKAALGDTEGLQAFLGDTYIAARGGSGWATAATSPPRALEISIGGGTAGGPFAFGEGLSGWVGAGCNQRQSMAAEGIYYRGGPGGAFTPLSPVLEPIDNSGESLQFVCGNFSTSGTAADLSATVFPLSFPSASLLPGDPPAGTYLAQTDATGEPDLQLLNRDKDGKVWGENCGGSLGGSGGRNQGAISFDGGRILLSARPTQPAGTSCDPSSNPLRIIERIETPGGPEVVELLAGGPATGDDLYQGASVDQTKVYLATPRALTASDLDPTSEPCSATIGLSKGCDLYLYDSEQPPGSRLSLISQGEDVPGQHEAGKGADVLSGTTAISPDGSRVYFAAQGVLTADQNPAGAGAVAEQPNLYLYETASASLSFLGTLAPADAGGLWGAASFTGGAYAVPMLGAGGAGGDGHILMFASKATLTGGDTDGGFRDVYRYDAEEESLQLISKPAGGSGTPADVEVNPNDGAPTSNFATQGRWASEDGQTVAFATAEQLTAEDQNNASSPYLWREGALASLPGQVTRVAQRPVVSAGGEALGFSSPEPLLPLLDGDTATDAYLIRAGGGFPNPVPPPVCDPLSEGSCQGAPSTPPALQAPATATFSGPGNPSAHSSCAPKARRAKALRRRARTLRRRAARSSRRGDPRAARHLRRKARASAKQANRLGRGAKRCRQATRGGGR